MLWQIIKELYAHIEAVCCLLIKPVPCPSPAGLLRLHTYPTKQMDACLLNKQLLIDVASFCLLIILNLLTVSTNACFLYISTLAVCHCSRIVVIIWGPHSCSSAQFIYESRLKANITIRVGLRQRTSKRSLHKTPWQRSLQLLIYIEYLQMFLPHWSCTLLKE